MKPQRLAHLSNLMGAWLNQDYGFYSDDEMTVVDDYGRTVRANDLATTVAEIDALLATPTEGLLGRFIAETGFGNMLIAEDDEGAPRWLSDVRDRLAMMLPPTQP